MATLIGIFNIVPAFGFPSFFLHACLTYWQWLQRTTHVSVFLFVFVLVGEYYQPLFSGAHICLLFSCVDLKTWETDLFSVISANGNLAIL